MLTGLAGAEILPQGFEILGERHSGEDIRGGWGRDLRGTAARQQRTKAKTERLLRGNSFLKKVAFSIPLPQRLSLGERREAERLEVHSIVDVRVNPRTLDVIVVFAKDNLGAEKLLHLLGAAIGERVKVLEALVSNARDRYWD